MRQESIRHSGRKLIRRDHSARMMMSPEHTSNEPSTRALFSPKADLGKSTRILLSPDTADGGEKNEPAPRFKPRRKAKQHQKSSR